MTTKPLSATSLNKFSQCGFAYKLKYHSPERETKPNLKVLVGSFVGNALQSLVTTFRDAGYADTPLMVEYIHKALIATMDDYGCPSQLTDLTLDVLKKGETCDGFKKYELDDMWTELSAANMLNVRYKPKANTEGSAKSRKAGTYLKEPSRVCNTFSAAVVDILSTYGTMCSEGLLSNVEEVRCEYKFDLNIRGVDFTGLFDILLKKTDGTYTIIEVKHSSSSYTPEVASNLNQVALYAIAGKSLFGKGNYAIYLVNAKDRDQTISLCSVAPQTAVAIVERANTVRLAEKHEVFMPSCGGVVDQMASLFCGFANVCPHFVKKGLVADAPQPV
jgi:hypothetical protein